MDKPKVFGEGVLTLAISERVCVAYVGANEVNFFANVTVEASPSNHVSDVGVQFERSHDPEVDLKLEEAFRLMTTLKWVRISR